VVFPSYVGLFRRKNHYVFEQKTMTRRFLKFLNCDTNFLKQIREVILDSLNRYPLCFAKTHKPGSIHAAHQASSRIFLGSQ
jgi:hypothetical protein